MDSPSQAACSARSSLAPQGRASRRRASAARPAVRLASLTVSLRSAAVLQASKRPASKGGDNVRKPMAAAGTAVFFVLAPGVVAGLLPWWLTGWRVRQPRTGRPDPAPGHRRALPLRPQPHVPGGRGHHRRAGAGTWPARPPAVRRGRRRRYGRVRPWVRGADPAPPVRRAVPGLPACRASLVATPPPLAAGPDRPTLTPLSVSRNTRSDPLGQLPLVYASEARTERHALSPSDRHRLARIVTIPRSHRVAYRGLACWSWPGWVLNGGPQPPGRVFVVQVEPHRGATQQAQLRQFRPHQLKGRLPACAGDGQVDVLLPQALPATGALAELVLAEQGIQHVFEVVARPKLLDRAPLARDRERHQQEHVVFWLAHRLHLPVIALLVGGASHAGPTAVRTPCRPAPQLAGPWSLPDCIIAGGQDGKAPIRGKNRRHPDPGALRRADPARRCRPTDLPGDVDHRPPGAVRRSINDAGQSGREPFQSGALIFSGRIGAVVVWPVGRSKTRWPGIAALLLSAQEAASGGPGDNPGRPLHALRHPGRDDAQHPRQRGLDRSGSRHPSPALGAVSARAAEQVADVVYRGRMVAALSLRSRRSPADWPRFLRGLRSSPTWSPRSEPAG